MKTLGVLTTVAITGSVMLAGLTGAFAAGIALGYKVGDASTYRPGATPRKRYTWSSANSPKPATEPNEDNS